MRGSGAGGLGGYKESLEAMKDCLYRTTQEKRRGLSPAGEKKKKGKGDQLPIHSFWEDMKGFQRRPAKGNVTGESTPPRCYGEGKGSSGFLSCLRKGARGCGKS